MTRATDRALIVIDAQESFRQPAGTWEKTANLAVLDNVARLVAAARNAGDVVVWVRHAEPGSDGPFDPANGFVEIVSEFEPRADELNVIKTSINAFTTTNLQQQLVQRGIRRLVICGIRTEQCCETTARIASDLGFDVEFFLDATTTWTIRGGEGYDEIGGSDVMKRSASVLGGRGFAKIRSTAEVPANS